MCAHYNLSLIYDVSKRYGVTHPAFELQENYDIYPSATVPVVIYQEQNQVELMQWGLIPSWAKDPKIGRKMFNARAETLAEKPSFRRQFQYQRCLIPAIGFYEWKRTDDGKKIPYYIRVTNADIFSFAGLYDSWKDAEGRELKTFTMITTMPNSEMREIHNRMPVILPVEKEAAWLDPDVTEQERLSEFLLPYPGDLEISPIRK